MKDVLYFKIFSKKKLMLAFKGKGNREFKTIVVFDLYSRLQGSHSKRNPFNIL